MSSQHLLITGSTIGVALAELFARDLDVEKIILTWHKKPHPVISEKIELRQSDLTNEADIENLVKDCVRLDAVVNTLGILHGDSFAPEKTIRRFEPNQFLTTVETNCLPTLLLAKHTASLLKASPRAIFTSLSARVGSIGDNRAGGWYSYRISKAALNMAVKNIAIEWSRNMPRCTVAALHPGTVSTPLSEPFVKSNRANVVTPEQAALNLKSVIDKLEPCQSGQLLAWDGTVIPW